VTEHRDLDHEQFLDLGKSSEWSKKFMLVPFGARVQANAGLGAASSTLR
jgi:hypothetical protein